MKPHAVILALLFLAACAPQVAQEDTIKIGFIGPLTGEAASFGSAALTAAQFAVQEINDAGGIGGQSLEIIAEDDVCDGAKSSVAVSKLINVDKVQVIIGSLCSASTLAAAPIAEDAGVVMLSYGASAPSVSDAGDFIFRDYPSDTFVAKFLSEYFVENGYERIGILACLDEYCQGVADAFDAEFTHLGGTIVGRSDLEKDAADLRSDLVKLKQKDPDALLTILWQTPAISSIKQSEELGWDVLLFGGDSMADPAIAGAVGKSGERVHLAALDVESMSSPELNAYLDAHGSGLITGAPQAYDAIHILGNVMIGGARSGTEIRDALQSMDPYEGLTGTIAFDEHGDLTSAQYTWYGYRDGDVVPIQ